MPFLTRPSNTGVWTSGVAIFLCQPTFAQPRSRGTDIPCEPLRGCKSGGREGNVYLNHQRESPKYAALLLQLRRRATGGMTRPRLTTGEFSCYCESTASFRSKNYPASPECCQNKTAPVIYNTWLAQVLYNAPDGKHKNTESPE